MEKKISYIELVLGLIGLSALAGFGLNLYSHIMLPSGSIDMVVAARDALYEHRLWQLAIIGTISLVGLAIFQTRED